MDDDNYVNPKSLLHLLSTFSSNQDIYLGRPSLDHPIEATERVQGGGTVSAGLISSPGLTQGVLKTGMGQYPGFQAPWNWQIRCNDREGLETTGDMSENPLCLLQTPVQWPRITVARFSWRAEGEEVLSRAALTKLSLFPVKHSEILVCYWWGWVLPEQGPCPQNEPMGQVSGRLGAQLLGLGVGRATEVLTSLPSSLGSFMSTAERVRLPDDCTVGYIVEGLLGARLLRSPLFHSHLENLQRLPSTAVLQQVEASNLGLTPLLRGLSLSPKGSPTCSGLKRGLASEFPCPCGGGPWPLCLLNEGPSGTCPWQVS